MPRGTNRTEFSIRQSTTSPGGLLPPLYKQKGRGVSERMRRKVLTAVVVVSLVTLLIFLSVQVCIAKLRLNGATRFSCEDKNTRGTYSLKTVGFLSNSHSVYCAVYHAVRLAQNRVDITTYFWSHNLDTLPCGFVRAVGAALARRKSALDVYVMCNRTYWGISMASLTYNMSSSVHYWKQIGVCDAQAQRFRWFCYTHTGLDNLHGKVVSCDGGSGLSVVWSGNVANDVDPDHDYHINDNGLWMTGLAENNELYQYTTETQRHCSEITSLVRQKVGIDRPAGLGIYEVLDWGPTPTSCHRNLPAQILFSPLRTKLWYHVRTSELARVVLSILRAARSSICIFGPNWGDIACWQATLDSSATDIRIVVQRNFDGVVPFIQKFLAGNRTNAQFHNEVVVPSATRRVQYHSTKGGQPILHGRGIIVDRETVILGSLICHTYGMIDSSELVVVVHDTSFAEEVLVKQFQPIWTNSEPY